MGEALRSPSGDGTGWLDEEGVFGRDECRDAAACCIELVVDVADNCHADLAALP